MSLLAAVGRGHATLKLIAAVLPLLAVNGRLAARWQRTVWPLTWIEGTILFAYGLVLTSVGLLIQLGIVHPTADADHRALAWHAFSGIRGFWCGGSSSSPPCCCLGVIACSEFGGTQGRRRGGTALPHPRGSAR